MKDTTILTLLASTFICFGSSEFVTSKNGLNLDVYHLPAAPVVYQNSTNLSFSPTAFTLIHGRHDAVLVDAPATLSQGSALAAWIEQTIPGKRLKAIYITHGHGDHFFTAPAIQTRYPGAQVVVAQDVYAHMLQQYEPTIFAMVWASLFPGGQVSDDPFPAKILPSNGTFYLEGHALQAVEVGQGDTYNSTVLHVPSLDLVVGGDVVYGHCHQLFAEDDTHALRQQWLSSLDKVAALKPKIVIPSHMQPGEGYGPSHLHETKRYIHVWEQLRARARTWQELEQGMKQEFPGRIGSFILRWSSQAPFGAAF
ncbi:hypothetical protein A1O1_00978 [Capronia coronata CBS 617.96]|uniref:Metallo-beta-lactamase domain-containing protein n=1 Tax=Capronia coronata CBS 617.96 TaxID=1182541 RepID=W9YTM5_9EURO|nr:uncharacterized protein A1O1_00978 [Capronia coronata CBS 617.96]EXJ95853.1 hypothetical protein A1O1_00978 [Capronia coronata CBS 617.96]